MEEKLCCKNAITLDGRMDEPAWETAKEYTGFKKLKCQGGEVVPVQTSFKILCCEDRVYIGIKCMEPDMESVLKGHHTQSLYGTDAVELFLSPAGNSFEFYQFVVSIGNQAACQYYSEAGTIHPDPYAPDWKRVVYTGEDYWSIEYELPLTAFYMTSDANWNSEWLVNVCRSRIDYKAGGRMGWSSWSDLDAGYLESHNFRKIGGFPMRPACNDVRIASAVVDIAEETEKGLSGTMTVKTVNHEAGKFEFTADNAESAIVELAAGTNEFAVPCCFAVRGTHRTAMQLKRLEDGVVFKRFYPVKVTYEAIKVTFTKPEFRTNFYPGQDYSTVEGKVVAAKPVTLKLEGAGIKTQIIAPNADGSFCFDTADFEIGEAWLTASIEGLEIKKKLRRLAPSKHMMTWISGGNLIVNGEPVLRRNMYAEYYHGGEAFKRRYDADDLHQTLNICGQLGYLEPSRLVPSTEGAGGEATKDVKPCDEIFRKVDEVLEANKDRDFAYYYLSDEPECRGISPVYLKYMYDYITDKDPYHVVLMASRSADRYAECNDWFEVHPYIDPQEREGKPRYYERPFHTLGEYINDIAKLNRSDRCVGFLSTCFSYKFKNSFSDYPTFDEYICHTWAAMIAGGKTLWPYAYHDLNDRAALYEGTRYVFSSFEALERIVLLGKRTYLYNTKQVRAVLYDKGDEKMFVVVNMTNDAQEVTVEGISGTWHEFRHNRTITGNTFALKPLEVVIGTSEVKDAGLPTYQETAALVDKLEYERTHRGSLLFDRHQEITVTTSSLATALSGPYKLFDGIRDNYAWEATGKKDKFYEMDLTKLRPTVKKVAVYGYPVEDVQLKVRSSGELFDPEIAEVLTEEFSKTFILKEAITPEALRLESKAERIELYEIEAF